MVDISRISIGDKFSSVNRDEIRVAFAVFKVAITILINTNYTHVSTDMIAFLFVYKLI